jgi:hypothetical protein
MSNHTHHDSKEQVTYIGKVNYRNDNRHFGIKNADRLRHIYCIGKSGTGKSTLLLNMAIQDIQNGNGCCVIDPHSDVAETLLHYIPEERMQDVLYINPSDDEFPVAYNPLRHVHPKYQDLVASGLISTFKKIWKDSWGPRMEHILRFSLLTLLEYGDGTLLDVQPLLTDSEFRSEVLSRVKSQHLLAFWYNEYARYTNSLRSEGIAPILNKLGLFSASTVLRSMVGQRTQSFRLQELMDNGKIIIANLSKGKIGEDACTLIGSMLLSGIQLAVLYRAKQLEHTRRPFYVYVDEMHSFVTLSFADMLSESRKYGLGLFLTHQYMEQLPDEIRAAVIGNVGTLITFRIGVDDAEYLKKEFYPIFTETDLIHLPRYSMYLKLMIDGTTSQPFSASTLALSKGKRVQSSSMVIAFSRKKYGKSIAQVNFEVLENLSKKKKGVQANLFE